MIASSWFVDSAQKPQVNLLYNLTVVHSDPHMIVDHADINLVFLDSVLRQPIPQYLFGLMTANIPARFRVLFILEAVIRLGTMICQWCQCFGQSFFLFIYFLYYLDIRLHHFQEKAAANRGLPSREFDMRWEDSNPQRSSHYHDFIRWTTAGRMLLLSARLSSFTLPCSSIYLSCLVNHSWNVVSQQHNITHLSGVLPKPDFIVVTSKCVSYLPRKY